MVIDIRKKVTTLEAAKRETREVQKQFLKLGNIMSKWVDKYHANQNAGENK